MKVTPTALLVPFIQSAKDSQSQQFSVKKFQHQMKRLIHWPTLAGKMGTIRLLPSSLRRTNTTLPSEGWAAQGPSCKAAQHNLISPPCLAFPPAANQLWFPRRTIGMMTGWRMIWWKVSPKRKGFELSRMEREGTTVYLHLRERQTLRCPTGVRTRNIFHLLIVSGVSSIFVCFQVLHFHHPAPGGTLWKGTPRSSLSKWKWLRCQAWSVWADEKSTGHKAPPWQMTTQDQRLLPQLIQSTCRSVLGANIQMVFFFFLLLKKIDNLHTWTSHNINYTCTVQNHIYVVFLYFFPR